MTLTLIDKYLILKGLGLAIHSFEYENGEVLWTKVSGDVSEENLVDEPDWNSPEFVAAAEQFLNSGAEVIEVEEHTEHDALLDRVDVLEKAVTDLMKFVTSEAI